jgi:hypothetical protein
VSTLREPEAEAFYRAGMARPVGRGAKVRCLMLTCPTGRAWAFLRGGRFGKPSIENVHCSPRGPSAQPGLRTLAKIVQVWRYRQPADRHAADPVQKMKTERERDCLRSSVLPTTSRAKTEIRHRSRRKIWRKTPSDLLLASLRVQISHSKENFIKRLRVTNKKRSTHNPHPATFDFL